VLPAIVVQQGQLRRLKLFVRKATTALMVQQRDRCHRVQLALMAPPLAFLMRHSARHAQRGATVRLLAARLAYVEQGHISLLRELPLSVRAYRALQAGCAHLLVQRQSPLGALVATTAHRGPLLLLLTHVRLGHTPTRRTLLPVLDAQSAPPDMLVYQRAHHRHGHRVPKATTAQQVHSPPHNILVQVALTGTGPISGLAPNVSLAHEAITALVGPLR